MRHHQLENRLVRSVGKSVTEPELDAVRIPVIVHDGEQGLLLVGRRVEVANGAEIRVLLQRSSPC